MHCNALNALAPETSRGHPCETWEKRIEKELKVMGQKTWAKTAIAELHPMDGEIHVRVVS